MRLMNARHASVEATSATFGALAGLIVISVVVMGFSLTMGLQSYDLFGAFLVGLVLLVATAAIMRRTARNETDPVMVRILVAALVLKLVAALVRHYVAFNVYGGVADASAYHQAGERLSDLYRHGTFVASTAHTTGTRFIEYVIAGVYTVTGPTRLGGFLVFSWLGFWGLFLFYRAFCIAFPTGERRRYALLVFFLPSLLFWPSSIGKEAWMTFALGLFAYGAARVFARAGKGFVLCCLGLGACSLVRSHVALIAVVALVVAYLFRRSTRGDLGHAASKAVGVTILVLIATVMVGRVENRFSLEKLDSSSAQSLLDQTQQRTSQGGSAFASSRPGSLVRLPQDVFTVLYRPLPSEAHNAQSLMASGEGAFLLILTALSLGRLVRLPVQAVRNPFLLLAVVFVVIFCFAFASIGNFGLLARERTQMLPFLAVLLSMPSGRPVPADDLGAEVVAP